MSFVSHKMIKPEIIEDRDYQRVLSEKALTGNTLVVMPTALGKTIVAVRVIADMLAREKDTKILMVAPTRPLVNQHMKSMRDFLVLDDYEVATLTGTVSQGKREGIFADARVIIATPQTIRNDISKKRLDLSNVSLLVVDECHRSVSKYSYVDVSEAYCAQARSPLVLGMTASPSSANVEEICKNLHIKNIEVRTEKDEDVAKYIPHKGIEHIYVNLPDEFSETKKMLADYYDSCLQKLLDMGYIRTKNIRKTDLITLQQFVVRRKNFAAMPYTTSAIKISHALGLLETQGIFALEKYFEKLEQETTRSTKMLLRDERIKYARAETHKLYSEGKDHPKMDKLKLAVAEEFTANPKTSVIVFANYRDSAQRIVDMLNTIPGAKAVRFVGQSSKSKKDLGLKQSEQEQILRDFRAGRYNIMCCTSVGEEGLDIPSVDTVIFYEPVPSEIRKIQRSGRTGRKRAGKVITLITKNTRDEVYYWMSIRKEKKMHQALDEIKNRTPELQKKISEW
ncbi:MAG: helicase-related protein [Candidatus Micrarchaeota archaeon]